VAAELIKMGYADSIRDEKNSSGYSTDKNALSILSNDLPFAGNILEYRTVNKLLKTYVTRALTDLDEDGRLRYSFMIHGTKTSRLSCSFLHQLPRTNEIADLRAMLIADDAFDYTYLDFSQIELRIMAVCSKDQVMLDLFNSGADIHKSTAAAALGLPLDSVSDFNRQVGKAVNFGIIFGSEGYQLVGKLEYEDLEGKRKKLDFKTIQLFIARTKKHFYKMAEYCDNVPLIAMENGGTVVSVFGRRRRLGTMLNDYRDGIRKHAEREAVNFTIQGPAFSITARTIVEVKKYLDSLIAEGKLKPGDIRLLNSVHDSIAYETKKNLTKWFRGVLRTIAERPIPELDNYSFPCNIGVGDSWSSAELNAKEN
jgi:DNA polymerase-1